MRVCVCVAATGVHQWWVNKVYGDIGPVLICNSRQGEVEFVVCGVLHALLDGSAVHCDDTWDRAMQDNNEVQSRSF
jgi:hypothetical protein